MNKIVELSVLQMPHLQHGVDDNSFYSEGMGGLNNIVKVIRTTSDTIISLSFFEECSKSSPLCG